MKWSKLHHAYGPADDVPDLLRALVDPGYAAPSLRAAAKQAGREVRDHIEWTLWGNVFHQGTRWQVTAHVVPFLVEILCEGPKDDQLRRFVISYLHHLAMGYPDDVFPAPIDPDGMFREFEGMFDPGGRPDYEDGARYGIWARDCYLAVEEAIDKIVPFMDADDEETALEAIALAASFPRAAPGTVPFLYDIASARDDQRAGHAVVSLSQLDPEEAVEAAERLVESEDRVVAIQAACATLLAAPERVSNEILALLTSPLGDVAKTRSVHAGSLSQLVGCSLARVPAEHRERAVDAIAAQHRGASPFAHLSLSASLLRLAFHGKRPPKSAADLTPSQRRAVEAIRDHAFAVNGDHFVNSNLLMRDFGLPDSPEALRKWLDG